MSENLPVEPTQEQLEEYRREITRKTKEYIESQKKAREEEQRKREQEKAMKEEEERKQKQRIIESWQVGWSSKQRELYRQMCELVGDLRTALIDLSSESERMIKFKLLLQEFLQQPVILGESTLERPEIYELYWHGWIITIYKENNKWKIKYPIDFPHKLQLQIENDVPTAIEFEMRNELIPFTTIKGILKLKR